MKIHSQAAATGVDEGVLEKQSTQQVNKTSFV
jgi:hypothetical protein